MLKNKPHLSRAKRYWKEWLQSGDIAVDATCGNGWDTLFLAQLPLSALFAIDIQHIAIENTQILLKKTLSREQWEKVSFFPISHEHLLLPCSPHLVVYNLGYLPGGDKTYTTRTETTVASVKRALEIMDSRGAISITCYPGHEEGKREESALLDFISSLSPIQWEVCHHRWPNQTRSLFFSPSLFWIQRLANS